MNSNSYDLPNRLYKPGEVLNIVGLKQRRLSNLFDKRVVNPQKPAEGAGNPSLCDYTNLLEIAIAESLFAMKLSLHLVRDILQTMKRDGHLQEWANNFEGYFSKLEESIRRHFYSGAESGLQGRTIYELARGKNPPGTLLYFVHRNSDPVLTISPFDMERTMKAPSLLHPDGEIRNIDIIGVIMLDLGKIKKRIDEEISKFG